MDNQNKGNIIIYQTDDGLTQQQMVQLFGSSKANISEHISNIYQQGELPRQSTVRNLRTVREEGNRKVTRNLDKSIILSQVQ